MNIDSTPSHVKRAVTNPIDSAKDLLQRYRSKLESVLAESIKPEQVSKLLERMEIDSDIYLSLNPNYKRSETPFANFVHEQGLPEQLISCFPKLEQGLYVHQEQAILSILAGHDTIVATGTGSGKTEAFLIPIISHCLQSTQRGVKAILIYPMNALAGDQIDRLGQYTSGTSITFGLYTAATPENASKERLEQRFSNELQYRDEMRANPPDILITNYVMLDRMLTRRKDHPIFSQSAQSMRFLVLDELHTYTGSKAAHLKYLLARLKYYFHNKITHIGTSATLISTPTSKSKLDTFVHSLFNIGTYKLVEPVEEEIARPHITPPPPITDADLKDLDFLDEIAAATSIGRLTGQKVSGSDFYRDELHKSEVYQALHCNAIVAAIHDALHEGAQSFTDLTHRISRTLPPTAFSTVTPERLLAAYLNAISYVNQKVGKDGIPLMDFRTHVFVRHMSGYLKTCPKCGRYFSGDASYCPDDGFPLFAAWKNDIDCFIGKFHGQRLTPIVEFELDSERVHYVLITKEPGVDKEVFTYRGDILPDGEFRHNADGQYYLAHLPIVNADQLDRELIWLGDPRRDYLYISHLVKTLLHAYRKTLVFVDSREKASRYSAVLQDEYATDFFKEFLRHFYPSERQLDITHTLAYLEKVGGRMARSVRAQALFKELPLWYHRHIAIPERSDGYPGLLTLKEDAFEWGSLSDIQHKVLGIFLRERALLRDFQGDWANSQFIRFQKFWATSRNGIYVEDTISEHPDFRGISLGPHAKEYTAFVEENTPQAIRAAVHELVDAGLVACEPTPDGKAAYYLRPEYIRFALPSSHIEDIDAAYEQIERDHFLMVSVHSSDLRTAERIDIENGFSDGSINCVFATPTLEMGIDIGGLDCVVMLGAPPSPANYIQRAGRAGRGKHKATLIVTYCWGDQPHDLYVFQHPHEMINGLVSPPVFNPYNPLLAEKHVTAFVLRDHVDSRDALIQFRRNAEALYQVQLPLLRKIFGDWFDYDLHLNKLKAQVDTLLAAVAADRSSLAHRCYIEGIFPDYSFRHDEVIAIDVRDKDKLDQEHSLNWKDYALTSRDVEQAIKFFVPEQTIFVAGEVYRTLNDGIYTTLSDGARCYSCFYAEKEMRFAKQWKHRVQLSIRQHFAAEMSEYYRKDILFSVSYAPQCRLSFRNHGIEGEHQDESQIHIGYDLEREAIIFRFAAEVTDPTIRTSLIAAILQEITDYYELARGEIRLMFDVQPHDNPDRRWIYTLLYDNDGNNNLPLKQIAQDFETLVARAYERLTQCPCNTDGCYHCIRSYDLQRGASAPSKQQAIMFLGYLLDHNRFQPVIPPFEPAAARFDLRLTVRQRNNEIIVDSRSGAEFRQPVGSDLNTALFSTLTQAIYQEFQAGMTALLIETPLDWLAMSLNERRVKRGVEAFNRLQFALLNFKRVEARKLHR